jgi:hypothetical protein
MRILRKAGNSKRKRTDLTRRAPEESSEPRNFQAWLMRYRRRLDQICETTARSDLGKTTH